MVPRSVILTFNYYQRGRFVRTYPTMLDKGLCSDSFVAKLKKKEREITTTSDTLVGYPSTHATEP